LVAHPFGLDWSHLPVQPLITYLNEFGLS
jgi:hypothetical protein